MSATLPVGSVPFNVFNPGGKAPKPRSIKLGPHRYPVFLPNIRDARLHVAGVVMTIHVLGQTVLDFRVSVPQILAAILSCFLLEIVAVFSRERVFRWPASAMLTGSGIGLIMRLPTMEAEQPWSTKSWWMYAAVASGSLATKYLIQSKNKHVFNPSNLGLMFVFVVLGSHWAEPLDFWWKPIDAWMVFAYALIIAGGSFVTWRVGLLPMAATFWVILGVGLGAVALTGHEVYSPSSLHPVSGFHYWWLVITSPETLIFVYFMLSDPKTVPRNRTRNMLFGGAVALLAVALMAPQTTEYGTKVALLGALTICCALRWVMCTVMSRRDAAQAQQFSPLAKLLSLRPSQTLIPAGLATLLLAIGIIEVGDSPLRDVVDASALPSRPTVTAANVGVSIAVTEEARRFDQAASAKRSAIAAELVTILEIERFAARQNEPDVLHSVTHGKRLTNAMTSLRREAGQSVRTAANHRFSTMELVVVPSLSEGANRLGIAATGEVSETEFSADGSIAEVNPRPFNKIFVLRKATDRWLLVDEINRDRQVRVSLQ
jgi:hypothetical protein